LRATTSSVNGEGYYSVAIDKHGSDAGAVALTEGEIEADTWPAGTAATPIRPTPPLAGQLARLSADQPAGGAHRGSNTRVQAFVAKGGGYRATSFNYSCSPA
jgi:hypothetical protein